MAKRAAQNDRLRRAREERNLTQSEVAQAIGTSSFTVSRWELGVQAPQPHFREKLCTLFTLSPQELGLIPDQAEAEPHTNGNSAHPATGEQTEALDAPAPAPARIEDPAEARARHDLVAQVRRYWIDTELEAATADLPHIELCMIRRPSAVEDPVQVLRQPDRPDRPVESGTTIETIYRRAGQQLLILGEPGAGKTTLLLDLTRRLLEAGDDMAHGPVPVVFHLSSWAEERRPLGPWLVDELHRRYGVAHRLGRAWIAAEQVLPLLDGLDEVADEHRPACVAAINAFLATHGQLPLVVCCRTGQYRSLGVRLRLRDAVVILPLARPQIEAYLADAGDAVRQVRALLDEDERLWDLLTTPLFLAMIVRTYGPDRAARPLLQGALTDRRRHVLSDYVSEMMVRPRAANGSLVSPPHQTIHWLGWLARAMRDHGEGVFYLDWMQPSWLPTRGQRRLVTLGPAALLVLTGGLIGMLDMLLAGLLLGSHMYKLEFTTGFSVSLSGDLAAGMVAGAVVGAIAGMLAAAFTYERRIAPTQRLAWSWTTFRRHLPSVAIAVLGAVTISLAIDRVLAGVVVHLLYGLLLIVLFKALTMETELDPMNRPRRAWAALRHRLPRRWQLVAALVVIGAAVAGVVVAAGAISGADAATVAYRFVARMIVGLSLGLMFGPETPLSETVPAPGRAIEESGHHGLNAGLVSGAVAALVFGVVSGAGVAAEAGAPVGLVIGLADGLSIGVIVGAGVALRRGGGAFLRHAVLRRLLVRNGAAPADYVGFLDHASNLILLRRRGGGYEFVHRLLLEHFADS